MPLYDPPGTAYNGSPSPGASALRKVCMAHFGVGDLGIVRDRNRCPPNGPKSVHCEARAWDAKVTAPSAVGDALATWAAAHAEELGIQEVIWNRRAFAYWNGYQWGPYGGASAHTDHVHIGLTRHGAATLTEAKVRAALGSGGGDDDMTDEQNTRLKNAEASAGRAVQKLEDLDNVIVDTNAKLDRVLAWIAGGGGGSGGGLTPAQAVAAAKTALKEGSG